MMKPFHVNVSQEWYAEAEAFVLANSKEEAESIAEQNISFNPYDSDSEYKESKANKTTYTFLENLRNKTHFYFFVPHANGCHLDVNYETFMSYFTPEEIEKMRIEKIEKNNGQLPLSLEIK